MSAGSFLTRDFIRYVLPAVLLVLLFYPLFADPPYLARIPTLALAGAAIGIVVSPILDELRPYTTDYATRFFGRYRDARENRIRQAKKWDLDLFFDALTPENRDYIQLSQAYAEFYATTALVVFVYGAVNLGIWVAALDPGAAATSVRLILDLSVHPGYLAAGSAVVFGFLIAFYVRHYETIFASFGAYENLARLLQMDGKPLAHGLWGHLSGGDGGVADATLTLQDHTGTVVARATSQHDGYFVFEDVVPALRASERQTVQIVARKDDKESSLALMFRERDIQQLHVPFGD